jgi:predicted metal-dependent HD superfamily phosphohydrolase
MDVSDSWPLPESETLRDELLAAYAEPSRGYHDTRHLAEVLERLFELSAAGAVFDPVPVLLAAWFHDAVYDGERDAEERSAAWAEDALSPLVAPELVAEVARLVRLTETHSPEPDDVNGHALSDADLGILAADRARYDEYVAAVRREYAHLADAVFAAGRLAVLEALAEKEHLFHTAYATLHWEAVARDNLERELAGLRVAAAG